MTMTTDTNWEIPVTVTPTPKNDNIFEAPRHDEPVKYQQPRRAYRPRILSQSNSDTPIYKTLNLEDLNDMPDPEWLVDGVLPAGVFTVLFGAPGSTKSFWALDAACAVASGYNLHGATVKEGKVVLAVGEGLRGLKWRIEAWRLAHPGADADKLRENLIIIPESVRILDPESSGRLVATCKHYAGEEGLRLFILDTWARAMTGGDENSSQDTGLAIDVCETISTETGATTLVVHHTGADGIRERGSTALRGAADAQLLMARNDVSGVVTMRCTKIKDGEQFADQHFSLQPYGHSAVLRPHQPKFGEKLPVFTAGKSRMKDESPFG